MSPVFTFMAFIPPPPISRHTFAKKPIAVVDTECFKDYWLIGFTTEDGQEFEFDTYPGKPLDIDGVWAAMHAYTIVTFNGMHYDSPMIMLACYGADTDALKVANDRIIPSNGPGLKSWEFLRAYGLPEPEWDHVDLKEPTPGVMVSLKVYGGRLHAKRLQETPEDFTKPLPPEGRAPVAEYCRNDRRLTLDLMYAIKDRLELRAALSVEYGVDLRSKSDAQIAEAVIKHQIGGFIEKPFWAHGSTFKYETPHFIKFNTPLMREVLAMVEAAVFTVTDKDQVIDEDADEPVKTGVQMPAELKAAKIQIGATMYKMGIGGLHSQEKSIRHLAREGECTLMDADVTSYYPSIILNCALFPAQLGPRFLSVFRGILDARVHAKGEAQRLTGTPEGAVFQTKADGLKIVANGSFGKFGSKYSILFSPTLLIQTTITGQLALLMLIEMLEACGIPVASANTDGIVIKCPAGLEWLRDDCIRDWEQRTGFKMEFAQYAALYSRDVNNYVAIKPDGKVKTKGIFAPTSLAKSPANTICFEAVVASLAKGTPIEDTIHACRDITKFLTVRKVSGGAVKGQQHLGVSIRWYYGVDEMGTINYATSGNRVPRSEGAVPMMDLPDEFPADVDYTWYVREAFALLGEVGAL